MVRFAETHRTVRATAVNFRAARAAGWTPEHLLPLTVAWPDGHETELNLRVLTSRQASWHRRHWFSCPACERRVGALYAVSPNDAFLCRWCKKLRYVSQYRRRPRAVEALAAREGFEWVRQVLTRRRRTYDWSVPLGQRWKRVSSVRVRLRFQVARSQRT